MQELLRTINERPVSAALLEEFRENFLPTWQDNYRTVRANDGEGVGE